MEWTVEMGERTRESVAGRKAGPVQDGIAAAVQHAIWAIRRKSSFAGIDSVTGFPLGSAAGLLAAKQQDNVLQRYGQMGKKATLNLGRVREREEIGKGGDSAITFVSWLGFWLLGCCWAFG